MTSNCKTTRLKALLEKEQMWLAQLLSHHSTVASGADIVHAKEQLIDTLKSPNIMGSDIIRDDIIHLLQENKKNLEKFYDLHRSLVAVMMPQPLIYNQHGKQQKGVPS